MLLSHQARLLLCSVIMFAPRKKPLRSVVRCISINGVPLYYSCIGICSLAPYSCWTRFEAAAANQQQCEYSTSLFLLSTDTVEWSSRISVPRYNMYFFCPEFTLTDPGSHSKYTKEILLIFSPNKYVKLFCLRVIICKMHVETKHRPQSLLTVCVIDDVFFPMTVHCCFLLYAMSCLKLNITC